MTGQLDRTRLLGWLHARATQARPVLHAAYQGLADRIERGDFDTTKETAPESVGALNRGLDHHLEER